MRRYARAPAKENPGFVQASVAQGDGDKKPSPGSRRFRRGGGSRRSRDCVVDPGTNSASVTCRAAIDTGSGRDRTPDDAVTRSQSRTAFQRFLRSKAPAATLKSTSPFEPSAAMGADSPPAHQAMQEAGAASQEIVRDNGRTIDDVGRLPTQSPNGSSATDGAKARMSWTQINVVDPSRRS